MIKTTCHCDLCGETIRQPDELPHEIRPRKVEGKLYITVNVTKLGEEERPAVHLCRGCLVDEIRTALDDRARVA